jgi:N-acetylneuraminate synthase
MDPNDLRKFLDNIDILIDALGNKQKKPVSAEKMSRKFARRSIVATCNISKGSTITKDMITFKRPGTGISPKEYKKVLGKKTSRDIKNDELLVWDDLKKK